MVLTKVSPTPTQHRVSVTRSTYARTFRLPHVPAESSILSIPRVYLNLSCGAVLDDDTTPKTESIASNYIRLELHLAYAHTPFEFRMMKVNKPQKPKTSDARSLCAIGPESVH